MARTDKGSGVRAVGSSGAARRATLDDVAALAKVSRKTVSRVVNGEPGVAPATAQTVQAAVARLDYRLNLSASALRRSDGRTSAAGAVLEDLANPFSAAVLRGVEDVLREHGMLLFAGSGDEDPARERALVRALSQRRVDGLVLAPTGSDHGYLRADQSAGMAVVFVDRRPRGILADAVLSDNARGAGDAVRHLAAHGHRRIAYLGDLLDIATAAERFDGYRRTVQELGLALDAPQVHDLHATDLARDAVHRLMRSADPPTALFSSQNLVTIGAVSALQSLDLDRSVALVGFDDFPLADLLRPPVTVVAQDAGEIGRLAATQLLEQLAGTERPPQEILVPTRLVARGSGELAV
jgi:LacI family transcriptional regulator